MTAATRLVWDLAGHPSVSAESVRRLLVVQRGVCAICDTEQEITADANRALGSNFSDHSYQHHPGSSRICEACLWCCSGKPPATLRMWSLIAAPDTDLPPSNPKAWLQNTPGLFLFNRSAPETLNRILANPPLGEWTATVAVSAQKHILPYATVNYGSDAWSVRMEDHNVTSTPQEWKTVHDAAMKLRRMGVPSEAVMEGIPQFIRTGADLLEWRRLNITITPWLGSPLLDLALWTITKGTMNNES